MWPETAPRLTHALVDPKGFQGGSSAFRRFGFVSAEAITTT